MTDYDVMCLVLHVPNLLYLNIYIYKQAKNKQNSDWLNLYLVKTIYISFCSEKILVYKTLICHSEDPCQNYF